MSITSFPLELISRYIKPTHNYPIILLQLVLVYFIYCIYKTTIIRLQKYRAYRVISYEKPVHVEIIEEIKQKQPKEQKVHHKTKQELKREKEEELKKQQEMKKEQQSHEPQVSLKELMKQAKHQKLVQGKEKQQKSSQHVQNSAYLSAIKGFSNVVTGFAFNDKYACASSMDSTIKIFEIKEFYTNSENPKSYFYKTGTQATAICISKKQSIIHYAADKQIMELHFNPEADDKQYFKVFGKTKNCHKTDITAIHVDDNDRFLITTSSDTYIKVWNMKGDLLKELNTSYGEHYGSCFSSNLLILSSWSVDSSIFECKVNKDGTFKQLDKVMVLRGEKTSVIDAYIDEIGNRATLANKSSIKIFNIHVEHRLREEPKLLKQIQLANISAAAVNNQLLLIATDGNIQIFDDQFNQTDKIDGACNGARIKQIRLHQIGNKLLGFVWGENEERVNIFDLSDRIQQ